MQPTPPSEAAAPSRGEEPWRGPWAWAGFALVALLVLVAFAPALRGGLLDWDDAGYVVENEAIRSLSPGTVWWALTQFCCNYWAPLTWLSLGLDRALWGLDPFGYHLTNNLLHAANSGLLFLVVARLLARAGGAAPGPARAGALLAALLWGLHPLRVESVAWVAERKDVLSAFFGLLAVLAYLEHAAREAGDPGARPWSFLRRPAYLAAAALFLLSLLSKAALVTLPPALLLLDAWPLRRLGGPGRRSALLEKLPLLAMAAAASLVTMAAMAPTQRTLAEIGLSTRVIVAFTSLATYLRLTLMPAGISPVYFHPNRVELSAAALTAIGLVLALSAGAALAARRRPALLLGWLFFLVTLAPVIGLTQNGKQELAPRFTYVPGMALSALAGAGFAFLLVRLRGGASRAGAWAAAAAILAGLAAVTARDIGHWRDDVALWSRVVELDPSFGLSFEQRAHALERAGRFPEALADVERAERIAVAKGYAGLPKIQMMRGRLLERLGGAPAASTAPAGPGAGQ